MTDCIWHFIKERSVSLSPVNTQDSYIDTIQAYATSTGNITVNYAALFKSTALLLCFLSCLSCIFVLSHLNLK